MNGELKEFVLNSQKEHTKLLTLYNLFFKVESFGKNWIFIWNDAVGRFEKFIHLIIFLVFLFIVRSFLGLAVGYVGIHFIIRKIGEFISGIYGKKLNKLTNDCQRKLNDFCQEEIQKNKIIVENEEDEIRFDDGFVIKNGYFEADLKTGCEPIHIYCLKDKTAKSRYEDQKVELNDEADELFVDMKKNIASTEFNQKFGVFTVPEKEHECMKLLTPICQLKMVKSEAFNAVREIHIWNEKVHASMVHELIRPNIRLNQFEKKTIRKAFEAVEYYYETTRYQADMAYSCYLSLKELANN